MQLTLVCSLLVSVLRGLPGQIRPVRQGVQDAACESGLLHAHAIHTPRAVGLLGGPKVSTHLNNELPLSHHITPKTKSTSVSSHL